MRAMEIGGGSAPHQGAGQQDQQQQLPFLWGGTAGAERTAKTAGMVGWAHTLLHDTRASAVVNGWVSQPRTWEAGVRQGCPLAPAMYLFVARALHCCLRTCPAMGLSVAGRRICAAQYADNCVALLGACTCVPSGRPCPPSPQVRSEYMG